MKCVNWQFCAPQAESNAFAALKVSPACMRACQVRDSAIHMADDLEIAQV